MSIHTGFSREVPETLRFDVHIMCFFQVSRLCRLLYVLSPAFLKIRRIKIAPIENQLG